MHTYVREKRILLNIIVSPTLRKQRNPTEKSIDFNDAHSVVSFWSLSSFHYDRLALVVVLVSLVSFWWFRLFRFGGFGCFVLLFRFQCMLWSVIHVQYAQTVTIRSLTNRHTVNTPEVVSNVWKWVAWYNKRRIVR